MKKRRLLAALMTAAMTISLAACGGSSTTSTTAANSTAETTAAAASEETKAEAAGAVDWSAVDVWDLIDQQELNFKIGIMSSSVSQGEENYRSAIRLQEKYGEDKVLVDTSRLMQLQSRKLQFPRLWRWHQIQMSKQLYLISHRMVRLQQLKN